MTIHKRARLTPLQRKDVWHKYHEEHMRVCDLMRQYSVTAPTIYKIIHRGRQHDFSLHKSINKRFRCLQYGIKRLASPRSGRANDFISQLAEAAGFPPKVDRQTREGLLAPNTLAVCYFVSKTKTRLCFRNSGRIVYAKRRREDSNL
jgi:hypothetical protein